MAYVKTTWQTGDVITAEKLNNMEGGIEAVSDVVIYPGDLQTDSVWLSTFGAETVYVIPRAFLSLASKFAETDETGGQTLASIMTLSVSDLDDASAVSEGAKYLKAGDVYLAVEANTRVIFIADDADLGTGTGT